jgi:hypothetical protein
VVALKKHSVALVLARVPAVEMGGPIAVMDDSATIALVKVAIAGVVEVPGTVVLMGGPVARVCVVVEEKTVSKAAVLVFGVVVEVVAAVVLVSEVAVRGSAFSVRVAGVLVPVAVCDAAAVQGPVAAALVPVLALELPVTLLLTVAVVLVSMLVVPLAGG